MIIKSDIHNLYEKFKYTIIIIIFARKQAFTHRNTDKQSKLG